MNKLLLLFIGLFLISFAYSTDINACQEITASGDYVLIQNLSGIIGGENYCLRINASNVNLNLAGYTIDHTDNVGSIGISIYGIQNNVSVYGGRITDYEYGISAQFINNSKIENLTIFSCLTSGMYLNTVFHNSIAKNNISYSGESIRLRLSSSNNTFSNNTISKGVNGIYSNTNNLNYYFDNLVFENSEVGAYFYTSHNNTFQRNIFRNNTLSQLRINAGVDNKISNNVFNSTTATQKTIDLTTATNTNFWNTTKTFQTNIVGGPYIGGNWFSNYTGTDSTGDGIGDTTYNISTVNIDYFPLVNYTNPDTKNPEIIFSDPTEISGISLKQNFIEINATAYDLNLKNITINLYDSSFSLLNTTTQNSALANESYFVNYTNINYGTYYYNATAYDLFGYNNATEIRNITLVNPYLVSDCQIIDNQGYYNLSNNIHGTANPCIILNGENITLNGRGYTLNADALAIQIISSKNISIMNISFPNNQAIQFDNSVQNVVIEHNTFNIENDYGNEVINFNVGTTSENVNITENRLYSNISTSVGIGSAGASLYNSNIFNNSFYNFVNGLYLTDTIANLNIFNNYFYNCSQAITAQIYVPASNIKVFNNYFNFTAGQIPVGIAGEMFFNITKTLGTNIIGGAYIGGNYYSNYTGTDPTGDGIGEENYTIDSSNVDYLPLTNTRETTAPLIWFVPPTLSSGVSLDSEEIIINISAYDLYLKNITIWIYDSSFSLLNTTTQNSALANESLYLNYSAGYDTYYYNATAYDLSGNMNFTATRSITLNYIPPVYPSLANCSNYVLDSGNFETFTLQNCIYAVVKPLSERNNNTCYSDFDLYSQISVDAPASLYYWAPTWNNTEPNGFDVGGYISVNGAWFFSNVKSYANNSIYGACSATICNMNDVCLSWNDKNKNLRFSNNKIEIGGTNLSTNGFFYIASAGKAPYSPTECNPNYFTFFQDIISHGLPIGDTPFWQEREYISTAWKVTELGAQEWKTWYVGRTYSMGLQQNDMIYTLCSQNGTTETASAMVGIAYLPETLNNSYYANILTTTGQLIKPQMQFVLNYFDDYPNHAPKYKAYNLSDYTVQQVSNKASVLIDEYGNCFFVPPYSPYNVSTIYTLTGYSMACDAQFNVGNYLPYVPMESSCRKIGNEYIANMTFTTSVLFEEYFDANGTITYAQQNSLTLDRTVNLSDYTKYTLWANGIKRCEYDSNLTSILGFTSLPMSDNVKQLAVFPLFLVVSTLSFYNPFIFVFNFAINDWFDILSVDDMFFLTIVIGLFSTMFAWEGQRTLKTLLSYFLLGGTYLIYIHSMVPFAPTQIAELTAILDSLHTLFSGVGGSADIISIITITIPTFLINFVVLLLKLPAIVISLILVSFGQLLPGSLAYLSIFEPPLVIGAYAFIALKIYEIGRNMFHPI
jgi:parallel beta-helix repeat protein